MRIVMLFPGQGAQYPGMGRVIYDQFPRAREILRQAEALSGLPLREVCLRGPDVRLRQPNVLEPALTALAVSYVELLAGHGVRPDCVAGYSAGEVAALYAAGVVSLTDALRLAVRRGRALQEATTDAGRMVAVAQLPTTAVERVIAGLRSRGHLAVAAWNAVDHTTIVGEEARIQEAARELRALGGVLTDVAVAGPWHCAWVAGAARRVQEAIADMEFRPPRVPVYTSATGEPEDCPERLRHGLAEQIARPVRWRPIVTDLLRLGVRHFVEVGAGRTLYGFLLREARATGIACRAHFVERENGRAPSASRLLSELELER
jgi:[acyl-carrier-protein] S-malonyltransferase